MKRLLLFGLLVTVVCTPLFFVAFLLTAAKVPALDSVTLRMPQTVRSAVAQLALGSHGGAANAKTRGRVLKLDPTNYDANNPCIRGDRTSGKDPCATRVVGLDLSAAEQLNTLGLEQEHNGDPCTAEDTFTEANSKSQGGRTQYLRNMGRAAYECGRFAYSVSEFGAAEDRDALDFKDEVPDDPEDASDTAVDLTADREWLSLAYTASRQPQLAGDACLRAHTAWKACRCTLEAGKPSCRETGAAKRR